MASTAPGAARVQSPSRHARTAPDEAAQSAGLASLLALARADLPTPDPSVDEEPAAARGDSPPAASGRDPVTFSADLGKIADGQAASGGIGAQPKDHRAAAAPASPQRRDDDSATPGPSEARADNPGPGTSPGDEPSTSGSDPAASGGGGAWAWLSAKPSATVAPSPSREPADRAGALTDAPTELTDAPTELTDAPTEEPAKTRDTPSADAADQAAISSSLTDPASQPPGGRRTDFWTRADGGPSAGATPDPVKPVHELVPPGPEPVPPGTESVRPGPDLAQRSQGPAKPDPHLVKASPEAVQPGAELVQRGLESVWPGLGRVKPGPELKPPVPEPAERSRDLEPAWDGAATTGRGNAAPPTANPATGADGQPREQASSIWVRNTGGPTVAPRQQPGLDLKPPVPEPAEHARGLEPVWADPPSNSLRHVAPPDTDPAAARNGGAVAPPSGAPPAPKTAAIPRNGSRATTPVWAESSATASGAAVVARGAEVAVRGGGASQRTAPAPPAKPPADRYEGISWEPHHTQPNTLTDLRRLSDGMILEISSHGPVLREMDGPRRQLRRSTFVPALKRLDRVLIAGMSLAWVACIADFWAWWLEPAHRVGVAGLIINSVVLLYVSGFPLAFVFAVNRLRKVSPGVAVPLLRVAFVVTRAPSEPWSLVRSTLSAMLAQDFPFDYDVWLCDEQPTAEIFDWCVTKGVKLSTRSGMERYHRESWPRRTRCKEGNLAYFYDRWGYSNYDVAVQLDCDHKPEPGYLTEMVRPFSDPAIGYVAAPSVCDKNAVSSWAARGRLHREATFHGPLQLGHSDGLAPACIGSHYAVRTRALRDIGGLGPELAEDFSTTFLLTAAGWHGAFAIDAEAHGDGPTTFAAMLVQEFQWSRSLTSVLFGLVPHHLRRLRWPLRLRFLYALSYYVLIGTTTLVGVALAPIAAVTGLPWMKVNYLAFLAHWWSISFWIVLIVLLLRRRGLWRPPRAPFVSWENWLYAFTRWPYVAWGVGAAVLYRLRPRPVTFKVTPKGGSGLEPLPGRIMAPYILIAVVSSCAALYGEWRSSVPGYVFLCILGALSYTIVLLAVPLLHAKETAAGAGVSFAKALSTSAGPLMMALLAAVAVGVAIAYFPAFLAHAFGTTYGFGMRDFSMRGFSIHGFSKHAFGL